MPHRDTIIAFDTSITIDTSLATQQAINPGYKCQTGIQAQLSNKLLVQHEHNPPAGSKCHTGTQA